MLLILNAKCPEQQVLGKQQSLYLVAEMTQTNENGYKTEVNLIFLCIFEIYTVAYASGFGVCGDTWKLLDLC